VELPNIQLPTALSDSKSINTSLLEVMICSKNKHVFIRDLSDLTLQIIFNGWWASLNVGSKGHVGWNHSKQLLSWWFHLHCRIAQTGCPAIIFTICHQVLCHPSKHGTSSKGKHLLAKGHIAKLNYLTESEVTQLTSSTVDETAFAILKR